MDNITQARCEKCKYFTLDKLPTMWHVEEWGVSGTCQPSKDVLYTTCTDMGCVDMFTA